MFLSIRKLAAFLNVPGTALLAGTRTDAKPEVVQFFEDKKGMSALGEFGGWKVLGFLPPPGIFNAYEEHIFLPQPNWNPAQSSL